MSYATIKKLSSLYNSNLVLTDEVAGLRSDVKEGLKKVEKATRDLDKANKPDEVGAWRKVEIASENTFRPLVKSDVETALKKLNILG